MWPAGDWLQPCPVLALLSQEPWVPWKALHDTKQLPSGYLADVVSIAIVLVVSLLHFPTCCFIIKLYALWGPWRPILWHTIVYNCLEVKLQSQQTVTGLDWLGEACLGRCSDWLVVFALSKHSCPEGTTSTGLLIKFNYWLQHPFHLVFILVFAILRSWDICSSWCLIFSPWKKCWAVTKDTLG